MGKEGTNVKGWHWETVDGKNLLREKIEVLITYFASDDVTLTMTIAIRRIWPVAGLLRAVSSPVPHCTTTRPCRVRVRVEEYSNINRRNS